MVHEDKLYFSNMLDHCMADEHCKQHREAKCMAFKGVVNPGVEVLSTHRWETKKVVVAPHRNVHFKWMPLVCVKVG